MDEILLVHIISWNNKLERVWFCFLLEGNILQWAQHPIVQLAWPVMPWYELFGVDHSLLPALVMGPGGTWIPTALSLLWPRAVLSALAKAILLGWMGYPCRKGCFQEGKDSCRRAQHVPTCQTCYLRFTSSFSYQHPYPDRPKTDFSVWQRTNSWCTQAERSHAPNVQLSVSRRALHQTQRVEIPGISMGNSVLSLILLSALEGAWWFHHSPQEERWVHWAHLDVLLGASAAFTLQHLLSQGNK